MKKVLAVLAGVAMCCACGDDDSYHAIKPEVSVSEFTDTRDMTVYRCVTIGGQTWMAENLRFRLGKGSIDGCYTYKEEDTDANDVTPDYEKFKEAVIAGIAEGKWGELSAGMYGGPSMLEMYFDYAGDTEGYIELIESMAEFYPDDVEAFEKDAEQICEDLVAEGIYDLADKNMQEAEEGNGNYVETHGLLYTFDAAQQAVPEGWRVPTDEDWKKLEEAIGMPPAEIDRLDVWRGHEEGRVLKSGEEGCGFDALLSGARVFGSYSYGMPFIDKGARAYFWSSSKVVENDTTDYGITRLLAVDRDQILRGTSKLTAAYSVRCIKE